MLTHVPAHWPALPRSAACGQRARPAAARGLRAAARPARLRQRHRGRMVRACPRTELGGWRAPGTSSQRVTCRRSPSRAFTCGAGTAAAASWRTDGGRGACGGLSRCPGRGGIPVETAMPAHSRNLFPAQRQPSPGTVPTSWPGASQPPRGTPQLGTTRARRQIQVITARCVMCDGRWQRHHAGVTDQPLALGPHNCLICADQAESRASARSTRSAVTCVLGVNQHRSLSVISSETRRNARSPNLNGCDQHRP